MPLLAVVDRVRGAAVCLAGYARFYSTVVTQQSL